MDEGPGIIIFESAAGLARRSVSATRGTWRRLSAITYSACPKTDSISLETVCCSLVTWSDVRCAKLRLPILL